MRFYKVILFLLITCRSLASDDKAKYVIHLGSGKEYAFTESLYSYTEGHTPLSPQLVYQFFEAGKFRPKAATNNQYINDGLVNKRSWLALQIENLSNINSSVVLEYILSGANTIKCYTVNEQQEIQPLIKLQNINKTTSGGLLSKSEIFNITFLPGEKIILLMNVINNGQLLYIPTSLFEASYFRVNDSERHNFFGIFQGIFLFIIVFNLLLYLTTYDKIYLIYMAYAFFISQFALNEVGTASNSLPLLPFLNFFSGQTFLFAGFAMWLLLMLYFLNVSRGNVLFYRSTITLFTLNIFFAFLPTLTFLFEWATRSSFQQFYQTSITLLFTTNLLFIIISNTVRILNGSKLAIFYAVANIPVILGAVIYYTNFYNISDIANRWSNPVALGLSIETFLISFGFAYRYNLMGKEKQKLLLQVNKQQQETTQQIMHTQEEERKRIAEDLHDELGSSLAAIKLQLQKTTLPDKKLSELLLIVDKASSDARNISHNLMPPEFEKTPLCNLLSSYYSRLSTETPVHFTFHNSGSNHHFSKDEELIIYRIIMELTNNILKHAQATEAALQMIYYEDHLQLMVEDNGKGLKQPNTNGIGIKNIYSRINYLNGSIQIDSNNGTTVMIEVPYKKD